MVICVCAALRHSNPESPILLASQWGVSTVDWWIFPSKTVVSKAFPCRYVITIEYDITSICGYSVIRITHPHDINISVLSHTNDLPMLYPGTIVICYEGIRHTVVVSHGGVIKSNAEDNSCHVIRRSKTHTYEIVWLLWYTNGMVRPTYEKTTNLISYGRVNKSYVWFVIMAMSDGRDLKSYVWDDNRPYVMRTS